MTIATLLVNANNICCQDQHVNSKKRLIEKLSLLLASNAHAISANCIFKALIERERLGSTGLGKGVAIPHARVAGLNRTIAAMMTLATPIDYAAADNQPVDIIYGLLVPINDNNHLDNLANIVAVLRDDDICQSIRNSTDSALLFSMLLAINEVKCA